MITVLYTTRKKRVSRDLAQRWLAELSYARQAQLQRLRHTEDLDNSLLGMQLLKTGMEHMGFPGFRLSGVHYGTNRKPHLSGDVDFCITHSGVLVVCALTKNGRIGIDTEKSRPVSIDSFSQFLSESERAATGDSSDAFIELWTCKEAALKGCRDGRLDQLKEVVIKDDTAHLGSRRFYLRRLELMHGYKTCLATSEQQTEITLLHASLDNDRLVVAAHNLLDREPLRKF